MSFEKYLRQKQIEKEARDAAFKSVNEVFRQLRTRSEFEKHYLSLEFYTEGSAQLCLDACTFDEKQDAYLPNMDWILENDEDECVTYCCMLNTAYLSFKKQQSKIENLKNCINNSKDIVEGIIARSIGNLEIQELCGDLLDVLGDIEDVE